MGEGGAEPRFDIREREYIEVDPVKEPAAPVTNRQFPLGRARLPRAARETDNQILADRPHAKSVQENDIFLSFFLISLIADGPHHYHPACGHKGSSHPSPVHALHFFYRDASSALLQLVNQWLNFTYSRSHAFRYERKNTNPSLVRIELTTHWAVSSINKKGECVAVIVGLHIHTRPIRFQSLCYPDQEIRFHPL